jgi:hypothetical protein
LRHFSPWRSLVLPLVAVSLMLGCGDLPTSPGEDGPSLPIIPSPAFAMVGEVSLGVLQWRKPLTADVTVSRVIGKKGGTIRIDELGVTLVVPRDALKKHQKVLGGPRGKVPLTITALAGEGVAFEFGPHGVKFSKPAYLIIDLSKTAAAGDPSALEGLVAVYYEGIPQARVKGKEVLPVQVVDGRLVFAFHHFSGYLLASG